MATEQGYKTLAGSDTFGASRTFLNDTHDALLAKNNGPTEPGYKREYCWWADTTSGLLKLRNAANTAWINCGTLADVNLGLVSLSLAGQAFTVDVGMGGKKITNLGLPSGATDAARKQELDLKAALAAPSFTGQVSLDSDPTAGTSAIRKSWSDAEYVAIAGATMTGDLVLPTGTKAAGEAMRRDDIEPMTTFNVSTGHAHTGSDSKKVAATDLTGWPIPTFIAAVEKVNRTTTVGWTDIDVSATLPSNATMAIIIIESFVQIDDTGAGSVRVQVRENGTTLRAGEGASYVQGNTPTEDRWQSSGSRCQVWVPVDSGRIFEYQVLSSGVIGALRAKIDVVGWFGV